MSTGIKDQNTFSGTTHDYKQKSLLFVYHNRCGNKCKFSFHDNLSLTIVTSSGAWCCLMGFDIESKELPILKIFLFVWVEVRTQKPQRAVGNHANHCFVTDWMVEKLDLIHAQNRARKHLLDISHMNPLVQG